MVAGVVPDGPDGPDGPVIGVLDLQGDVREHVAALTDVGCASRPVKRPADLEGIDGLILPGGESTTLSMLLESTGLFDSIAAKLGGDRRHRAPTAALRVLPARPARRARPVLPVLGTCAGLVLLAKDVRDGRPDQRTFDVLDAVVRRNGYGRQLQSFESEIRFGYGERDGAGADAAAGAAAGAGSSMPAVFIRAPLVISVGDDVEVLATLAEVPVLVRQGSVLATVFHPELTPDRRVHRLFAEMCAASLDAGGASFEATGSAVAATE